MKMKKLLMTTIAIFGLALISNAQIPTYVTSNGLVGWWSFNGNADDESGNGNNGTVNGATLTTDRFGNNNEAYNFNGVSDYIFVPNTLLPSTSSSLTISLWYSTNDSDGVLFSDRYIGINYFKYTVGIGLGQIGTGNYASNCNNPLFTDVITNEWTNLVIVKDLNLDLNLIYHNGNLVNSSSGVCYHYANNPTQIGRWGGGNDGYFEGIIDDIGFWNRALNQQEITDLYYGSSLGNNKVSQSSLFSVFPNPTQNKISVNIDSKLVGSVFTIYDNIGKAVKTGKLNSVNTTIELNDLSGGIYTFNLGENRKQTFKVVKE